MKNRVLVFALVLSVAAGVLHAQSVSPVRPISVAPGVIKAAPVSSGASAQSAASLPKDYEALYRKEVEKNRELKGTVDSLSARIAEMTRPGGRLVQAYCESNVVSRNTAGATSDCSAAGYACEPVSGLCRTSAQISDHCAAGFTYCSIHSNCVRTANECQ